MAAMFLCCVATSLAQFSGSGSGTESDPYLILNPIQLSQIRNFLNQRNVYFKMMADIDLTEFIDDEFGDQGWSPIGNSSASFRGILDGNGKMITGLWINRSTNDNIGLFGYMSGATIKNLSVVATTISGKDNVGGISGYDNSSTFSDVSFSGKLFGSSNLGGIIGCATKDITLTNSYVIVEIKASGDNVGGLIGKHDGGSFFMTGCRVTKSKIKGNNNIGGSCGGTEGYQNSLSSCFIYADVTGNSRVGGIIGYISGNGWSIYMNSCGYIGNVSAGSLDGNSYVGGLIGYMRDLHWHNSSHQTNCFAISTISARGDYAGGLIGRDENYDNNISNCCFSGTIIGKNYTAGLVGYNQGTTISNSYSMASVAGTKYVGGLVGYNYYATVKASAAVNSHVTATEGEVARIVGHNGGTIAAVGSTEENKSYNRTVVICQGVAQDIIDDKNNGTGVSATTLKLKATYVAMGWDFNDVWEIQETECCPYFKTQTAPPVITSQVVSGATTISGKSVDGGIVTLEINGEKRQVASSGNTFSFSVSPLQAGHEVRVSAKVEGKEQSYFTTATVGYLGNGKENDPYQVYTAADLTGVYRKGWFKLMNDIDLTDYINKYSPTEGWQSIGRDGSETIHFDGDGHKITGLWCNTTRGNTGLFSCFADGSIKNLTVEVANGKQVKGGANTGILIGKMINGTIENCHVSGTLANGTPVGGLVGLFDGGNITKCQAEVTINSAEENAYIGGLVGDLKGAVDQCLTKGALTATGKNANVAGLAGISQTGSSISNSYSTAPISSSYCAAGIVAYNYGSIDKCYAQGNLNSKNYAAGIVGYNDGAKAIVKNCVAMNLKLDVTYESQSTQGGGYGQRIIGGFKNGAPAPEMNNYALKSMKMSLNGVPQKIYDDIMNGTAKTAEELKSKSTYQTLGWDFSTIWKISDGETCPYFDQPEYIPEVPVIIEANSYSRAYGEANPVFDFKVQDGDLSGTPEIKCEASATSPVGTYPIVISKGNVKNKEVTFINGTLTITKAPLTVKAGTYTKKQGEDNPEFTLMYEGFKNNETEAVLTKKPTATTTATKESAPGEYTVTVAGGEAQNYELSYTNGKLTITEADPVIVTAKSFTREYGEANPTFAFTSEGVALNGMPEISCEATESSPVGTYPIVIKKGGVTNYNDTYVNGVLTITKAPLTVKAGTYTKKQGEENPEFILTYEGFKNNETEAVLIKKPTATTTATKESALGEYAVTVAGGEAQNYELSYADGKLIITEADPVTIIANSYTREYGDANPTFEFTSEGATLNGTPEISCEATEKSPVGTYAIVIKKGSVTNYNDTYVNGVLTITKAPLTVVVLKEAREQYEENPKYFTIQYYGWKLDDDESVLTKIPIATTTATKDSPVGDYPIVVSGGEAQNYELIYINSSLIVVVPAGIDTISADHPVDVYNVQGRKVRSNATTLKGLPKGVYIVNGRKVVVK